MPTSSPRWPARIWWRSPNAHRCLPGIEQRAFVDIDSLLRPVYGHHKQSASSGTPRSPAAEADITHRRHAIIETTSADLIDGPLAHIPSGKFCANAAWLVCAVMAFNLPAPQRH
jgi:hypothetical protein